MSGRWVKLSLEALGKSASKRLLATASKNSLKLFEFYFTSDGRISNFYCLVSLSIIFCLGWSLTLIFFNSWKLIERFLEKPLIFIFKKELLHCQLWRIVCNTCLSQSMYQIIDWQDNILWYLAKYFVKTSSTTVANERIILDG